MGFTFAQLPAGAAVSTAQRIKLLVTADGGGTDILLNATILAMMRPGPLKDAWTKTYATQALARAALTEGVSGVLTAGFVRLRPRTIAACSWAVDVNVHAVTLVPELVFLADVNLATALCEIGMLHTEQQ